MEELKVRKIKNGTVIDHISSGKSPLILKILNMDESFSETTAVLMNVKSEKFEKKDIVKIENQELDKEEVNKISLVSPKATINIIRNFRVMEKKKVELPEQVKDIVSCSNKNCVTNHEDVDSILKIESKSPLKLRCHYCETLMSSEDIF